MFTRIAVLLDGSALAEQSLPVAIRLARYLKARVLLLQAVDFLPLTNRFDQNENQREIEAELYLQSVCKTILDTKLSPPFDESELDYQVIYDEKPGKLAETAALKKADLIVMTTHGRTGLSRLVMGSFATNLVRHSPLPVVLVRPPQFDPARTIGQSISEDCALENENNPLRLVVPLDSLPGSEISLQAVAELAHQLKATIYLLNIVPASKQDEIDNDKLRDIDSAADSLETSYQAGIVQGWKNDVFNYLEEVQVSLEAQGLSVVKVVRVGNPAEQIAEYINVAQPAMLVMATHGRDHLGRLLLGNLAEKVMQLSNQPVMMIQAN